MNSEAHRIGDAKYKKSEKGKARRKEWERTDAGKSYLQKKRKRCRSNWLSRHREQWNCNQKVYYAVKAGLLKKPKVCSGCGKECLPMQLHAHHRNYSRPLDVEWFCRDCHNKEHSKGDEV